MPDMNDTEAAELALHNGLAAEEGDDNAPVEIDLSADGGEVVEPEGEGEGKPPKTGDEGEQEPPKKRTPRGNARIQNLTTERDQALTYAQQLAKQLEEARAESAREREAREAADRTALEQRQVWLQAQEKDARAALSAAIASGDPDKQAEANSRLARVVGELGDVETVITSSPKKPAADPQQQPQRQQPQQQPQRQQQQLAAPVQAFISENSWFDPNSNDFDPEMHDEAVLFARNLERKIKAGRVDMEINSPEYFDAINNYMDEQFGDAEPEPQQRQPQRRVPPMNGSRQPVAPTNRNGSRMQQQPNANRIQITGEEKALVKQMIEANSPGFVYPRGHEKAGQKMSLNDGLVTYAKHKQADQKNQSQKAG